MLHKLNVRPTLVMQKAGNREAVHERGNAASNATCPRTMSNMNPEGGCLLCCKKHRFVSVSSVFLVKDTSASVNIASASFSRDWFGDKPCRKAPFKPCFTSSWSPSRTVLDRDPFGLGCWTQELQHYPRVLPSFLQTKPIEHRLLLALVRLFIVGRQQRLRLLCAKPVPS